MKQWRVPNRPPVSHIPIHNPYIPPAPMPSGVQLPLTSVRSFPSAKYANVSFNHKYLQIIHSIYLPPPQYFPMKANINKAKSFPTHYPNNTMECFTEQLPPNGTLIQFLKLVVSRLSEHQGTVEICSYQSASFPFAFA